MMTLCRGGASRWWREARQAGQEDVTDRADGGQGGEGQAPGQEAQRR